MGLGRKEQGGEKVGRKGGEEEEGRESHACSHVRLFGSGQQEWGEGRGGGGQGLSLLLHLTTSGPGSPAHSHKHMVSQLLPLATYLERKHSITKLNKPRFSI